MYFYSVFQTFAAFDRLGKAINLCLMIELLILNLKTTKTDYLFALFSLSVNIIMFSFKAIVIQKN